VPSATRAGENPRRGLLRSARHFVLLRSCVGADYGKLRLLAGEGAHKPLKHHDAAHVHR
jgi:hypothetical protein